VPDWRPRARPKRADDLSCHLAGAPLRLLRWVPQCRRRHRPWREGAPLTEHRDRAGWGEGAVSTCAAVDRANAQPRRSERFFTVPNVKFWLPALAEPGMRGSEPLRDGLGAHLLADVLGAPAGRRGSLDRLHKRLPPRRWLPGPRQCRPNTRAAQARLSRSLPRQRAHGQGGPPINRRALSSRAHLCRRDQHRRLHIQSASERGRVALDPATRRGEKRRPVNNGQASTTQHDARDPLQVLLCATHTQSGGRNLTRLGYQQRRQTRRQRRQPPRQRHNPSCLPLPSRPPSTPPQPEPRRLAAPLASLAGQR
jgi:hypothetical protein